MSQFSRHRMCPAECCIGQDLGSWNDRATTRERTGTDQDGKER